MIRKILSITVLFFLTSYTLAEPLRYCTAQESSQDPEISYEEAIRRLDLFMQKIEELRSHIDRSQFDLEALLDKIGYEAEDIIRFVKEEIAFEQYPGLLRGAQGTLMSRAGNSLDQSVLLATLLKDASYDARIVEGEIGESDAEALVNTMYSADRTQFSSTDLDSLRQPLTELLFKLGFPPSDAMDLAELLFARAPLQTTPEWKVAQAHVELIEKGLPDLAQFPPKNDVVSKLNMEATHYFWVQWRVGPSENWKDVHPAVPNSPDQSAFKPTARTYHSDTVPSDLYHIVRFEVSIKQQLGRQILRHQIFEPWEAPVANLLGTTVRFRNFPNKLMSIEGYQNLAESIQSSEFFVPILNDTLPTGALAFDMDGYVISPSDLASGYAGLFRELAGKIAGAVEHISTLGSSSEEKASRPVVGLLSQDITFTLISPGATRTIRRTLFNLEADQMRASTPALSPEEVRRLLSEELSFMLCPGRYPPAFALDKVLERAINGKNLLELTIRKFANDMQPVSFESSELNDVRLHWGGHLFYFLESDQAVDVADDAIVYRVEPGIVAHRMGLDVGRLTKSEIDIVNNSQIAVAAVGTASNELRRHLIRQGIWETFVEHRILDQENSPVLSAFAVLDDARRSAREFTAIQSSNFQALAKLNVPLSVREEIRRDLDDGFIVFFPQKEKYELNEFAWYRTNPYTGETLGLMFDGRGKSLTEYLILFVAVAVGAYTFVAVWDSCRAGADRVSGKGLGCALCAAFAGVIAGVIVYTVGTFAAQYWSMTAGSLLTRLHVVAKHMKEAQVASDTLVKMLSYLIVDILCATYSAYV